MSEIAASVDASETLWTVDAVPDPEFGFYTVGSEIVQVIAGFPGGDPGYAVGQTFPAKIRVIRATNGTTAATHADGTALTAANAFSGGGGGVTVTDGTTTVVDATSVQVTAVAAGGGGLAIVQPAVISPTDPGAIGAGNLWVREFPAGVTAGQDPTLQLFVRNPDDDGWLRVSIGDEIDGQPSTSVVRKCFLDDGTEVARIVTGLSSAMIGGEPSGRVQLYTATVAQLVGSFDINAIGAERQIRLLHYDAAGNSDFTLVINDVGIKATGLPAADPSVAGQLYTDGAPSAGVPKALMVSGG